METHPLVLVHPFLSPLSIRWCSMQNFKPLKHLHVVFFYFLACQLFERFAMETLGVIIIEAGKSMTNFILSRLSTVVNFRGNIDALSKEMPKLINRKNAIKEEIELARREGKKPIPQVSEWLKEVEEIEGEFNLLLEDVMNNVVVRECSLNCTVRYRLSKSATKTLEEVKQLIISGIFPMVAAYRNSPQRPVERMPAPSIVGQKAASEMLKKLLDLLNAEGTKRIAVWGMGGVGKTTLARNLNNKLECSSLTQPFDMVIWVSVSKDLNLRRVQSQIAERLNLELKVGESMEGQAKRLSHRLKMQKKFLLILDDVWEKIDLDVVGIPQGDDHMGCKIILTTRSFEVCREMKTDEEIKVDVLSEEEAWKLFTQNAGKVVELEEIRCVARAIAKECSGLPLAIKTVGTSMRGKTKIELWKNALSELQKSAPYIECIEKEVFLPLKWSYDSLQSKNLTLCFLYCSLFPENFSIKASELIQCWIADGLIDEQQNLEESLNKGIALVEKLKDSCMLEHGEQVGTVKMHDVIRDVAIWIASSVEDEYGFHIRSGIALSEMPEKMRKSFKRVSFMNNMISRLPSRLMGCSDLSTLFLQGNPLKKIPDGFFGEAKALRVLNLSGTRIISLPPSLLQLKELRTLLLRDCCSLEKLPPLGVLMKLQVLDLFGTRIKELPKGMEMLSNLRELNLSRTHHLEHIEAGMISELSCLESLDMSFSGYKWDLKGKVDEGRATFDELLSLERLAYLYIRLDNVACLALDFAWLRRLRRFNIRISPRSCDSNHLPTQHDEKRVILRGVDLSESGLEGLLCSASALDLATCGGISGLCEIAAKRGMDGLIGLKSITISGCEVITNLIRGENVRCSVLPNLQHLTLNRLKNLRAILDGMVPNGGCLRSLRTMVVVDCPRLKNLISYGLLLQLQNLEEIKVSNCNAMRCIIAARELDEDALPKLKVIELKNLAKLTSICVRTLVWPSLERIEVNNCPMLEKLPLSACNARTIREIIGDMQLWNRLRWKDDATKTSLEQHFQACTLNTGPGRIERWV